MIQEQQLTSAQQYLWTRAQQTMKERCYEDAIFLAQCLLRSTPEFLEARKLARQAAIILVQKKERCFFEKMKIVLHRQLVRAKVLLMMKQQRVAEALVVLENFLATAPHDLTAHLLMATVAEHWTPPLLSLALFSLETALVSNRDHLKLPLEIARVALLPNESMVSWNPERAIEAYQQVLSGDPHHLEARQGLKNASALLSMKHDAWIPISSWGVQ
jgi:tetratricopeptide (TPR) repeat protein